MDLSEVVLDSDLAESYTIVRSKGREALGGWQDSKNNIPGFGVVSIAKPNELEMLPEGDRDTEIRAFHSAQQIFTTRDNATDGTGTSDLIVWRNIKYRVILVSDYSNRGYWKALAARMSAA